MDIKLVGTLHKDGRLFEKLKVSGICEGLTVVAYVPEEESASCQVSAPHGSKLRQMFGYGDDAADQSLLVCAAEPETVRFKTRWFDLYFKGDPFYNKNLRADPALAAHWRL